MIIGDGIVLGAGGATASIFVTGLSETDTVTARKDGKTVIGKWVSNPNPAYAVPDGYTQLDYIESTGTQSVNTGVTPTQEITFDVSFSISSYPNTYHTVIGSRETYNTKALYIGFTSDHEYAARSNGHYDPIATRAWSSLGVKYDVELNYSNNNLYVNGAVVQSTTSAAFSNPYPIYLFALNEKGTVSEKAAMKLYSCKIFNGSSLIRDFFPVSRNSDGIIGLYDLVEGKFYTNAGTGTFTAGSEIPQTIDGFLIDKIKDYGTWTVTATDGTNTQTLNVFVDAANTFFVNINYIYRYDDMVLWLDGTDFLDHSKNGLKMNRETYPSLSATDFDKPETNCYLFDNNSASTALYTLSNPVVNMDGFSFSWWMKVSSKPSYSCCWYMSKDASVSESYAIGCNTTIGTTGKYGVCARTSSGANSDVTSTYVTPTNTTLHCVLTYDESALKLYVNGQLVWSASKSLGFSSVSVGRINIGHNMWNTSTERFMGYMTDIRLYNAVLASDEILEMFETGTEIHF